MLRTNSRWLGSLFVALDHLISGATCVAVLALPGMVTADEPGSTVRLLLVALAATFLWPLLFDRLGLYESQRRASLLWIVGRLGLVALVSAALLATVTIVLAAPLAREFPLACAFAQLLTLGAFRLSVYTTLRLVRRAGRNYRNLLIIGSGPRARAAWQEIQGHPGWGVRVLAFADDSDVPVDPALQGQRVLKLSGLEGLFREQVVDEVLLACPRAMLPQLKPVVTLCAAVGVPVTLMSDLFGDCLPAPRVASFGHLPALNFSTVHHSQPMLAIKRGIDVVVASLLLVLAAPVLAVAALLIKATSPGPVLFRQVRCGLYGRRFQMIKLRTMHEDAEQRRAELEHLNEADGPVFKIAEDPRVTRVGRVLRRFSIDELPQLWNVIRGDMSLVGPRPPIPGEVDQYRLAERRRLSMRPGLTCLWQVQGRNQIGFEEWIRLDLEYIDHWSLRQDMRILAMTVPAVLRGDGAS